MSESQRRSGDRSLRPDLQALVNQVGLSSGKLELVIHEGSVQFIEIRPAYRVHFCRTGNENSQQQVESIWLHKAEPFVRSRLEQAIFDQIGRFGYVKVKVKDGVVFDWYFARRHRYNDRNSPSCG